LVRRFFVGFNIYLLAIAICCRVSETNNTLSMNIRIVKVPPGFAPLHIREQWIGVQMPFKNEMDDGGGAVRIGIENAGGYQVLATSAIQALKDAGKDEAVDFWSPVLTGTLVFRADCCEVVD
jgi:hypothetical protein